jgi:ABC-2 type transport system ATP-binding protein
VAAVELRGLTRRYGERVALSEVTLALEPGQTLAVLGPNGAGKTTAVRILTTLLQPTGGRAFVQGHDVVKDAARVREVIGLTAQTTAMVDELTGRENLEMVGRLYHLPRSTARARADDLLVQFDLADAGDRTAKTYSGGMLRRLDLAASLVAHPDVLFLDEPTTGLDPRSRLAMWDVIRALVASGTTLLLTTQYLDEADELADEIAVIDHGLVIAAGTSDELKSRVGGDVVEFTVPDRAQLGNARQAVEPIADGSEPTVDHNVGRISLRVGSRGSEALVETVRRLDAVGVTSAGLALRRPSLDDVFLALTGHAAEETEEVAP